MKTTISMAIVGFLLTGCVGGPTVQRADVQIVRTVGSWPYQKEVLVEEFAVRVVVARLNLFNNRALIEYSVAGKMSGPQGWRPVVKRLFISQRFGEKGKPADFEVMPLVDMKRDGKYAGGTIPFRIVVQEVVESLDWGENKYDVRCGDKRADFTLHQKK